MKFPLTMCLAEARFSHAGRGLGQLETGPSMDDDAVVAGPGGGGAAGG